MEKSLEKKLRARFSHLKGRCNCSTNTARKHYGGRGIKCEWKSFDEFLKDMGESFEKHVKEYGIKETTIDRIDVNGNYCKENCRRATRLEQSKNRRPSKSLDYNGIHFETLKDLATYTGINYGTLTLRLKSGWSKKNAIEIKARNNKKGIEYEGIYYESIHQLCNKVGISYDLVLNRLNRGYTLEQSIKKPKAGSFCVIEHKGHKFNSLMEFAEYYNIPYSTVVTRIRRGYTGDEIIEGKMIEYRGKKYKTIIEIAKEYGISKKAIYCKVYRGKNLIEAIDEVLKSKQ